MLKVPLVTLSLLSLVGLCLTIGQALAYNVRPCISWHCYCENKRYPAIERFANQYGVKVVSDDWGTPSAHQCGISFIWQNPKPATDLECKEKAQTFMNAWEKNQNSLIGSPFKGFVNLSWLYPCRQQ
jgi:glucuronate isomerase